MPIVWINLATHFFQATLLFSARTVLQSLTVDMQAVSQLLQASLDPRQNKQGQSSGRACNSKELALPCSKKARNHERHANDHIAELSLRQEEKKPGFSLVLLQITATDAFPLPTRLASALCFKNYVKWNWRVRSPAISWKNLALTSGPGRRRELQAHAGGSCCYQTRSHQPDGCRSSFSTEPTWGGNKHDSGERFL